MDHAAPAPDPAAPPAPLLVALLGWSLAAGVLSTVVPSPWGDLCYQAALWVPVLALVVPAGLRRTEPAWRWLATGVVLFAGGDLIWDLVEWSGAAPTSSLADLVYLAGYGALAVGTAALLRRHGGPDRHDGLLDGCLLAVPALVLVVQFLVWPGLEEGGAVVDRVVAAAYPLADTLLVAAIVWLLVTPGLSRRVLAPLTVGLGLTLVLDVAWASGTLVGADAVVATADALFPAATTLLALGVAAGARTPIVAVAADDGRRPVPWGRVLLLGAGLVAAPLAAVLGIVFHDRLQPVLVVGATLVAATLVVTRFVRLVDDLNRTTEELGEAQRALLEQSVRDPLTGLFNRSVLAGGLVGAAEVHQDPAGPPPGGPAGPPPGGPVGAALLSIDLDRFKAVNDRYGHAAGDAVLSEVARRLEACTRPGDIVVRMGGDEFLVIAPGVDLGAAAALGERIVAAVGRPVPWAGAGLEVSASIGVVAIDGSDHDRSDPADLLHRADAAMYVAKRSGGGVELLVS